MPHMLEAVVLAAMSATARKVTTKVMRLRMMVSKRVVLGDYACTRLVRGGQLRTCW